MSDGMTRSMCAHLCVKYNPIDHDNGSASDRWSCDLCGHDFWPKLWLFPAPWMRERPAEPKLPPSEKAELQVSLLNEIGLTLTAMAKEQVAQSVSMVTAFASHTQRLKNIADDRDRDHQLYRQMDERIQGLGLSMAGDYTSLAQKIFDLAETQDAQRKSLEGIQGLLVDLAHSFDVIAEVQANSYDAVVTKFTHIQTRLAQIEERLANSYDAVVTKFTHIEKCLTHIEECAKRGRVRGDETCERLSAIEGHLERLISGRKTGKTARKRPIRKAGKRLKTSKL